MFCRCISSYKCIQYIFRQFFVLVICFILLWHSAKSPKIFHQGLTMISWARWTYLWSHPTKPPWTWSWTPGQTRQIWTSCCCFFRGRDTYYVKQNKGNKLCPPQKNIRSDTHTHTPSLNVKKVKIMEGLLGCPSNIFWYFLMIFAQTAFLRGRPTVIVENCSHGLYHGGLRKCNTRLWLCLIRFTAYPQSCQLRICKEPI